LGGRAVIVKSGDDALLVDRCLRGDIEAFQPLVERYQRVVFNVALRMLRDDEEARDAAQNAFVKAYEKLASYDPRFRFFSWLYRIAVNECLNVRERRRPRQSLADDLPSADRADREVESRELAERVQAALMTLSLDYRLVVVLRHFAELSYAEMSEVLQVPEKTVKSRLHTARQRLGEVLLEWRPAR
jgi:RNA polymerase sigma-70 factor (ECF subfamily)